ncbi:MAG: DoxX family membrane protein [Xanthobacteraceae bacterium]
MINGISDKLILAARILLATLFLIFGWRKLRDFSGTVSQMAQLGVPTPVLAAAGATFMELPVAFAVAVGALARPSALLMFFYTLGTALIGHRYWTVKDAGYVDSMDSFGNTWHFHWAKSGEYVTQITAIGPLGMEYKEAHDDPRSAARSNSRV